MHYFYTFHVEKSTGFILQTLLYNIIHYFYTFHVQKSTGFILQTLLYIIIIIHFMHSQQHVSVEAEPTLGNKKWQLSQ